MVSVGRGEITHAFSWYLVVWRLLLTNIAVGMYWLGNRQFSIYALIGVGLLVLAPCGKPSQPIPVTRKSLLYLFECAVFGYVNWCFLSIAHTPAVNRVDELEETSVRSDSAGSCTLYMPRNKLHGFVVQNVVA